MQVVNTSSSRTITHESGGQVYKLEPMKVMELPEGVGQEVLNGWGIAQLHGRPTENRATEPWETRCGVAWEAAVKEHHIVLDKVKVTVGAKRPEVQEPEMPVKAGDNGVVRDTSNFHLCSINKVDENGQPVFSKDGPPETCSRQFPTLKGLRKHQAMAHGA